MRRINLIAAFGLGAAASYLFDPQLGRRRRSLVRDKLLSACCRADDAAYKTARDLAHRAWGLAAEARTLINPDRSTVPNTILEARVRSKIGRYCSHPRAISVAACDGYVQIKGPILAHEAKEVLNCVRRVPGVISVDSQLEIHKVGEDVPALQGGAGRPGERSELAQANWPPAMRFLADAAGGTLLFYGLRRGRLLGRIAEGIGLALILRGITNLQARRITGIGAGRRAIDIHKTINVDAPLDEVFGFWSRFDNFPRFMEHVKEVRDLKDGRSHWVVAGPAGISFEWNAVLTDYIPNQLLAWRTEPDSIVEHAGVVRFDENPDGSTRIDIRMSYNPVIGAIGHVMAMLSGTDPKHAMDDDLVRFKSLLEYGKASAHGKHATREEIIPV